MNVYELINEDVTNVGGPMGNNSSCIRYRKLFETLTSAKSFAENEHGKKLDWEQDNSLIWNSPDLSHTIYYIKQIKVNK